MTSTAAAVIHEHPGGVPKREPLVTVCSLNKSYGSLAVLKEISLTVDAGTILGLAGPNGVGKTTLLRIIGGLIPPDHGTIRLLGREVHSDRMQYERPVGFVPEEPALLEYLTAHELLSLTGELAGMDRSHVASALPALLDSWNLLRHEHDLIHRLSHGMKQKLMILLSLLGSPSILLLDEPLSGLDLHSAGILKKLLRKQADAGKAIIVSSHVLSLIADICDRMVILSRGVISWEGNLASLRDSAAGLEGFVLSHADTLPEPSDLAEKIHRLILSLKEA